MLMLLQFSILHLFTLFLTFSRATPIHENTLQIRQNSAPASGGTGQQSSQTVPILHWPAIQGVVQEDYALVNVTPAVLTTGYWAYTTLFDKVFLSIAKKNATEALEILFKQMITNQNKWISDCYSATNSTSKANNRTNTLARVVCFPDNNPSLVIDKYELAQAVEFGCWEVAKDGNQDQPLYDYTQALLTQFKWDKQSALVQVQQIVHDLGLDKSSSS